MTAMIDPSPLHIDSSRLPSGGARFLGSDERVVLFVRHHWAILLRDLLITVGGILLAIVVGAILSPRGSRDLIDNIAGFFAIGLVVRFCWRLVLWRVDTIFVSDQRVFEVSGLLTRNVASMPLVKLTDMTYRRSLMGRLCGYGHIMLETSGQKQAFNDIAFLPDPDHFYRTMTSLVALRFRPPRRQRTGEADTTGPLPRTIT
jgi:hypothetical protein